MIDPLGQFQRLYGFGFDDFQTEACRALESGHGVLVAAPTGAGKTVVGEFAVHLALDGGGKCFYTTPLKALSNQKYSDLVRRYSAAKVGLLTGDNSVNGEAPAVVMTTEVLRNMLYADSPTLRGLGYVVLDEVHYLADPFRGAVWEEVLIGLPESVRVVALSATVSNAEEFGEWLETVRGGTRVIVHEIRPVPLWQHMLVRGRLYDLFEGGRVSQALVRATRDIRAGASLGRGARRAAGRPMARPPARRGRPPSRAPRGAPRPPSRPDVISLLDASGLLPAITFIFSRAGCDAAVRQCLAAGVRLTSQEEVRTITDLVEARTADVPDLDVLGYAEWLSGLRHGLAAHHAGLLPTFKEVTEELFAAGLVRAVFATETLALGINMPARSVVIERLDKWDGQKHTELTPGEYTQLTGRAGRRGIDVEGHAVVLWQQGVEPAAVAGLAGTRTYPLNSSFRPSYNMAVNLLRRMGSRAAELLDSSFAQFQADRSVVGLARRARELRAQVVAVSCDRGDIAEYAVLHGELAAAERDFTARRSAARRAAVAESLGSLRRGDIIDVPAGRRAGFAVVLEAGDTPLVLTTGRRAKRLSVTDVPAPVAAVDRIRIPGSFNQRSPAHRRDLASTLRNKIAGRAGSADSASAEEDSGESLVAELRRRLRAHPCHGCPDRAEHLRLLALSARREHEAGSLQRRVAERSHVLARTFRRVCTVLGELGYLDGERVTAQGHLLASLYTELDLLAAECLRRGVWAGLEPAELAACASALTFESRRDDVEIRLPPGRASEVLADMTRIWSELANVEHRHRLSFLREPDPGFAWTAHAWARGVPLEEVLTEDLSPGDFVRSVKQVLDLLDQLAVSGDPVAGIARTASAALRRGIVAYSAVEA